LNRSSIELPIDGPSPARVIGGGAAAGIGALLAIAGPPFCVFSALPERADGEPIPGSATRVQQSVASWMQLSNALALVGLGLVLVGLLVLALTPGRKPSATELEMARATRGFGVAGTVLATGLAVCLVGWLSNAARWIAADEMMQELAARTPYAQQFLPSSGTRGALALTVVVAIAYLAATVPLLSIARDLRHGVQAAVPRASRWAIASGIIVISDAVCGVLSSILNDVPVVWTAARVAALAPWPVALWMASRGWKKWMRADDPEA
jgi:hypothetical protein